MRVIQCFRAPIGGLFRHVRDLAAGLEQRGIEVGLVCDSGDFSELEAHRLADLGDICTLGLHRIAMPRGPSVKDFSAVRRLRRLLIDQRIEVVHGHGAKGGAYARIAGRLAGCPAIYTPHGGSLHFPRLSAAGLFYLGLERGMRALKGPVIFESAYAKKVYAANIGRPPAHSRIIHNGLSAEEFNPVTPRSDAADLLFIGELRALKGPFVLIEAMEILAGRGLHPSLLMVGSGPDESAVRAAIPANLTEQISFSPPMPAREAFARARVTVIPSLSESLPYIVLEAAAAGVALITTNTGGIPEIFADQSKLLVEPGNAASLAEAIAAKLEDRASADRDALGLQQHVARHFLGADMVDAILSTYRESLSKAASTVSAPALEH